MGLIDLGSRWVLREACDAGLDDLDAIVGAHDDGFQQADEQPGVEHARQALESLIQPRGIVQVGDTAIDQDVAAARQN